MDVFLRVKPFFSHHSKDRTLMSDVETEGGTSWSHRAPASEGLSRDAGLHTAAARWLSISTLQFSLGAGRLCHVWGESNAASRLRPGWRGRCCRLRGLLRSGRVHHFPSIHPPARFHQRLPSAVLANAHFKTAPAAFICHSAASSLMPSCICAPITFY